VAIAIADGTLSKPEAESIYRRAKRLLPAEELPGLRRTLGRLSAGQKTSQPRAAGKPVEERPADRKRSAPTTRAGLIVPDKQKENGAQGASYEQPAADGRPAAIEPWTMAEDDQPEVENDRPEVEEDQPAADEEQPVAKGLQPSAEADLESPFEEEDYLTGAELWDDGTAVFQDCCFSLFAKLQSYDVDGWRNLNFYTTVDAFKGPLDLDDRNGNFGLSFALNAGVPVARRYGIGVQAGTSAVLTNFYGTQFTGSTVRSQNFTTVGLFQNVPFGCGNLKWGFAYDWLYDDYYTALTMGQWRVKLGYELDPCREIGIWATIPDKGDSARLDDSQEVSNIDWFKPIAQGSLYYRRCWQSGIGTTAWLGIADEPGEVVFGADAHVPITCRLALVGGFNYILPSASAEAGQDEEMWNLSMGIEWRPRACTNHCLGPRKYSPLLPLANNGSFAVRRF
jgi:hypothetical protein